MKQVIMFGLVLGALFMLTMTGCQTTQKPVHGVMIDETSPMVGGAAPTIAYIDNQGKKRQLSNKYNHATVIALIDGPCSDPNSEIVKLSNTFRGDITVVEISMDTLNMGIENHADCVKARGAQGKNIISLCDNQGLIRQKFQNAKPNTIFLLDNKGIIRSEAKISDIENLKKKMVDIIQKSEKEADSDYYSG